MKKLLKRLVAFIIDMFIVIIISEALSSIDFINIYKDEYQEEYAQYIELYNDALEEKVTLEEYNEKAINYNYNLGKLSIISSVIYIVITISYFVGFNCLYQGQTIGKKITRIRIVSSKDSNVKIWQYILRTIFLTGIFSNIVLILSVLFVNENVYYNISYLINIFEYILQLVIVITIILNKNGRGLHDIICQTTVVEE